MGHDVSGSDLKESVVLTRLQAAGVRVCVGNRAENVPNDADAPQDSLFDAQPDLSTTHAGTWSPHGAHYPLADLNPALTELLQVAPALRSNGP